MPNVETLTVGAITYDVRDASAIHEPGNGSTGQVLTKTASAIAWETLPSGASYSPVGTIIAYMGTTAPTDYLICDGSTYNIADYTQLATHITNQFGSVNFFGGDGTTTFAVPDLRGEFLRGTGTNGHSGQGSGANVGTHQNATTHLGLTYSISGSAFGVRTNTPAESGGWVAQRNTDSTPDGASVTGRQLAWNGGSFADTNGSPTYTSRPTNTSVLYCIAYRDSMASIVSAVLEALQQQS